jgi:tetratricopeptide (TPR) repeat protein
MTKTLEIIEQKWETLVSVIFLAMLCVGLIGFVDFVGAAPTEARSLPVLTSARLEKMPKFHILELTFEGRPRFSMQKYKGKFYMQLRNIDNSTLPPLEGATSLLGSLPIKILKDRLGTLTNIIVNVKGAFRTEMSAYEKPGTPFRVVVEFYSLGKDMPATAARRVAAKKKPAKIAKSVKKSVKTVKARSFWEIESETYKKTSKTAKKKGASRRTKAQKAKVRIRNIAAAEIAFKDVFKDENTEVAPFNDGWRWEYRKKVVETLSKTMPDIYREIFDAFAAKFHMGIENSEQVVAELTALTIDYEMEEELGKAETLKGIIPFFQDNGDVEVIDSLLRKYAYTGFTRLGRFVEGVYFERKGFTPEALAFYNLTIVGTEDEDVPDPFTTVIIAEANFRMGMVYLMDYKTDKALTHFKKASEGGNNSARKWLANTLLIKGRTKDAIAIYKEVEADDPITRMNLAEVSIIKKDYEAARQHYSELSDEFSGDALVSAYFMIRVADTYQIEGSMDKATRSYKIARENLIGDGRAMASLAMAEILIKSDDHEAYREALRYYRTVADGDFIGAQEAYLRSALLQMKLGNDGLAIALIDKMERLFPLGDFRHEGSRLKGNITLQWLDKLALRGDDHGFAKIFLTYETYIPYGKKSGAYIQAGRAFIRLGFITDAVKVLNSLVKMGKGKHLEEAMVLLARGYLAQEDIESADRLAMFFKATFPRSDFKKEFVKLRSEINYRKGQYDKVVSTRAVKRRTDWNNSEEMMVIASSFFRLGKYVSAEQRYRRAAELLAEREQNARLADACMGVAESSFMQGKYEESIKFYRCAAELSKVRDKGGESIDTSWATYRLAESNFKIGKDIEATEALKSLQRTDEKMAEWGKYLFAENGK